MPLKIIKCEESTIACFLSKVKDENLGTLLSLEHCKHRRKSSIVLGKIIKFVEINPAEKRVKILIREVLPDASYGMKFKAVIYDTLALQIINAALQTGDRLAFLEPHIFENPAFESKDIKYIIQANKETVMCYAKKQYILAQTGTSKDRKSQERETGNIMADDGTKKTSTSETEDGTKKTSYNETKDAKKKTNSLDTRQKPQIQLPVNPQIPSNTQKLNPRYVYKNLLQVKDDAIHGDLRRVNILAVVSEVTKGLSKTSTGKHTIICKMVDDSGISPEELVTLNLHFFTPQPAVISEVEQGDILRVHRMKMELYNEDVDGRIFNSQDVVLFKKDSPIITPISVIKNFTLTDEEKKKILHLQKWYKEEYGKCLGTLLKNVTVLSDITNEGEYCILCKVVSQPIVESSKITLSVSDGSVMVGEAPRVSAHLPSQYDLFGIEEGHLVTDIDVFERLKDYAKIKVNDYVFLRCVKAVKDTVLQLLIQTFSFPMILDWRVDNVLEIESRLDEWEVKIQSRNKDHGKKIWEKDENEEEIRNMMQGSQVGGKDNEISSSPQVTESCVNKVVVSPDLASKESCVNVIKHVTQKCDQIKTTECGGQKIRKPLFTMNYTDLSDATDDTSEVVVQEEEMPAVSQVVLSPTNLCMENLIELVKSKYCTTRTGLQPSTSKVSNKDSLTTRKTPRHPHRYQPVVKLVRLNDKTLETDRAPEDTDDKDFEVVEDCPEDASTVVNMTLDSEITICHRNKRRRLDSFVRRRDESDTPQEVITHKVNTWLTQNEDEPNEDLDLISALKLLAGKTKPVELDLSSFVTCHFKRAQVFLLKVHPDPTEEPLDLLSGFCSEGCQTISLFSTIVWREINGELVPFCPSCLKTSMEKRLLITFMLKLFVMDQSGNAESLLVCREHGEYFLDCSLTEFVFDEAIRRSRVELLLDNTLLQHSRPNPSSFLLLDLSVAIFGNVKCVVNSRLRLPPNP